MYLVIPNLDDPLTIFFEWEKAVFEAERMASHFYHCGFEVERKTVSKEDCEKLGDVCYAIYNGNLNISIRKVVVK